MYFPLVFSSLIRTTGFAEGTVARKNKSKKIFFYLFLSSLIRTFETML